MRFSFSLWLYRGLASQFYARDSTGADLLKKKLWQHGQGRYPVSTLDGTDRIDRKPLAISMDQRIASRLDHPERGRCMAPVRSMSLLQYHRARVLKGGCLVSSKWFCYESKIVEGFSWSIFILRLSCHHSASFLADKRHSDDFPDICNCIGQQVSNHGMAGYLERRHHRLALVRTVPRISRVLRLPVISECSQSSSRLNTYDSNCTCYCGTYSDGRRRNCHSTAAWTFHHHLAWRKRESSPSRTKTWHNHAQHIVIIIGFITIAF